MKNSRPLPLVLLVVLFATLIEYGYRQSNVFPISNVSEIEVISFEAVAPSSIYSRRFELNRVSFNAINSEIPNSKKYHVSDRPGFENSEWIDLWFVYKNGGTIRVRYGFEVVSCTVSIPVFCNRWDAVVGNIRHVHTRVSQFCCDAITANAL